MSATALLVSALLAQSAFSIAQDTQPEDRTNVGYAELSQGQPDDAIKAIEANRALDSEDPAALINLGNAYARMGETAKALSSYRAAIDSDTRYDLELSDGRWMDSRKAARLALRALKDNMAQAARD